MALSPEDRQEFRELIRETMNDGCLCGHKEDVTLLFGRAKAMGEGNVEKGIESMWKTIATMTRVRKVGEKLGGAIAVFVAVSLASGVGAILYSGIKKIVQEWMER